MPYSKEKKDAMTTITLERELKDRIENMGSGEPIGKVIRKLAENSIQVSESTKKIIDDVSDAFKKSLGVDVSADVAIQFLYKQAECNAKKLSIQECMTETIDKTK